RAALVEANIFITLGRPKEAIGIYDELLKRDSDIDLAANNMAALIAAYEYDDSALLEQARQLAERFAGSNNPLELDTLGWVYYRQGKLDEAMATVVRAKA